MAIWWFWDSNRGTPKNPNPFREPNSRTPKPPTQTDRLTCLSCLVFGKKTLGIQSPCQMMTGVYNHLQNARYLAFSEGDWIPTKNTYFPQLMVFHGDESHGIESMKNHLKNKQKTNFPDKKTAPNWTTKTNQGRVTCWLARSQWKISINLKDRCVETSRYVLEMERCYSYCRMTCNDLQLLLRNYYNYWLNEGATDWWLSLFFALCR